ncbi:hypothetical protein ACFYYS_06370 [Streptomyces sp. NPDC002120]
MTHAIEYRGNYGPMREEFASEEAARDRAQFVILAIDDRVKVVEL